MKSIHWRALVTRWLVVVGLLSSGAPAVTSSVSNAAVVTPKSVACRAAGATVLADPHAGAKAVNALIADMSRSGSTQEAIDAALQAKLCLFKVQGVTLPGVNTKLVASNNTMVTVSKPNVYLACPNEACTGYYYYVNSLWNWPGDGYAADGIPCPGCTKNNGGYDGIGISLSNSMNMRSYTGSMWGKGCKFGTTVLAPSTANQYGAGFRFQDKIFFGSACSSSNGVDSNARSGSEVVTFWPPTSCKTVQAFATYNHTWSSTTINGISIGKWSIGFSWNTTSNQWSRVSSPGTQVTLCP